MENGIHWHKLVEQRHQERIRETEMYWQFSKMQKSRRPIAVAIRARLAQVLITWGEALLPRQVPNEGRQVIAQ